MGIVFVRGSVRFNIEPCLCIYIDIYGMLCTIISCHPHPHPQLAMADETIVSRKYFIFKVYTDTCIYTPLHLHRKSS